MGQNLKPTIINVDVSTQNTEVSQAIPEGTRKLLIRSRNGNEIKLAYVSGESGTTFITIPASSGGKYLEGVHIAGKTLYMQTPDTVPDVIEIEVWQNQ